MKPQRRFTEHKPSGKPLTLALDHPAVVEGRAIFTSRTFEPKGFLLKPGINQRKIGSHVAKGRWSGMPIFTLTLEERATCPRACEHWRDCYGNHMPFSKRYAHGKKLEDKLDSELAALSKAHPEGFVVRLHILGDFYSVHYVMSWGHWLQRFPKLYVFGYTARDKKEDIGIALQTVRKAFPDRWWVRWSHRDKEDWLSTGKSGIVCPVQTDKTDCCGTCGLCWTVKKPIQFLVH